MKALLEKNLLASTVIQNRGIYNLQQRSIKGLLFHSQLGCTCSTPPGLSSFFPFVISSVAGPVVTSEDSVLGKKTSKDLSIDSHWRKYGVKIAILKLEY